ncbi:MAG: glycosyltransferase family 4 protein [Candidatus Geothermincolia bacterium]
MKLAFVVQRYGADIAGGSEAHCRELAERLSPRHDITVLTTCARDYVTWENAMPAGESTQRGVRVLRFPVSRRRRFKRFAEVSDQVFGGPSAPELQEEWFRENGPEVPALIEHLRAHGASYDAVLFWTFRYAPSYFGLPLVADRAILVPTAEEDDAIGLEVLGEYFQRPAGFLFLTPEEETLVSTRAGRPLQPSATIGMGLDPAGVAPGRAVLDDLAIPDSYLLYLGRVDPNKGCTTLLAYFQEYAAEEPTATLVLAGPAKMPIPAHPRIRALGYVSDDVRSALLGHARAIVIPSPYESLSIVLLEAWNHAVPALVNGRCKVLAGQVRRANGGLYYRSEFEFQEALTCLLTQGGRRDALGRQGLAYVEREYRWPTVLARVETVLAQVAARGKNEFTLSGSQSFA